MRFRACVIADVQHPLSGSLFPEEGAPFKPPAQRIRNLGMKIVIKNGVFVYVTAHMGSAQRIMMKNAEPYSKSVAAKPTEGMRSLLLFFLGVPIPIIILIQLFVH